MVVMDTATLAGLTANLNAVEGLVGHSTVPALRALLRPEVRRAFAVVAREFREGVIENDELLESIVVFLGRRGRGGMHRRNPRAMAGDHR